MRRLGHLVVDRVVDHLVGLRDVPPVVRADRAELVALLGGPLPETAGSPDDAIALLADVALVTQQHGSHPRYLARVPGPASFAGILGDWLATGHNAIASSWGGSAGPTTLELVALSWVREALGLPERFEGILASGGSMASLLAIAAARREVGHGVVYLTSQAHSCIPRALRNLGYADADLRDVPVDADLRLDVGALEQMIGLDRAAGRHPSIIVATAGSTNTGTVDPLVAVAEVARREGMWLHVDGAYGAPGAICEAGREVLGGLELADSLAVDPHKWLFQPYDAGILYVSRPGALERAFALDAEYLADVTSDGEPDLRDRTLELTRRARGVKLWLTIRTHGIAGMRAAIEAGIALAEHAEAGIRSRPELQLVTPARLGVVTFAVRGADREEHAAIGRTLEDLGVAALTSTELVGRPVLRLCTINPRADRADVDAVLDAIVELA
jgi:glutamate/tyrosine decarboxylase-like PLP-dependent enzyme